MDTVVASKAGLKTAAYAAKKAKAELAPWSIERREPGPHDVLIDIL
jgi:alcohol dehydrogenase (NADP+)